MYDNTFGIQFTYGRLQYIGSIHTQSTLTPQGRKVLYYVTMKSIKNNVIYAKIRDACSFLYLLAVFDTDNADSIVG